MHSIVTLTMNPALDISVDAENVRPTDKIRCGGVRYDAGGGGINVAKIAHALGAPVCALFPAGGATGEVLADLLVAAGIPSRPQKIAGSTRESFTVNETSSGMQYRFVLPGPRLTLAEQTQCMDELRLAASSARFVVASGSLPPGVPVDFYQRIAELCRELDVALIVDTSGAGLQHITSNVYLLKVSVRELRECCGRELPTEAEQLSAARELVQSGRASAVVVSLGAHGALLATAESCQRFSAVPVHGISGVGAGDAMVSAITVGLSRGWPMAKAVRFGIAAGAAMLMSPGTAPCSRADAERLFELADEPAEVDVLCP